jgi:hypothetical protein
VDLNLTVNEAAPAAPPTAGAYNVRAFYNEADNGHLFGPFSSAQAAEQCATVLAGRSGVVKVAIEKVS